MSENIFEWNNIKGNMYGRLEAIKWMLDRHSDIEIIANFDIEPFYSGSKRSTITYEDTLKYAANRLDGAMLMAEGPLFMNVEKWRPAKTEELLISKIDEHYWVYAIDMAKTVEYVTPLEKKLGSIGFLTDPDPKKNTGILTVDVDLGEGKIYVLTKKGNSMDDYLETLSNNTHGAVEKLTCDEACKKYKSLRDSLSSVRTVLLEILYNM